MTRSGVIKDLLSKIMTIKVQIRTSILVTRVRTPMIKVFPERQKP